MTPFNLFWVGFLKVGHICLPGKTLDYKPHSMHVLTSYHQSKVKCVDTVYKTTHSLRVANSVISSWVLLYMSHMSTLDFHSDKHTSTDTSNERFQNIFLFSTTQPQFSIRTYSLFTFVWFVENKTKRSWCKEAGVSRRELMTFELRILMVV